MPDNTKGLPFYSASGFEVRETRSGWGTSAEDEEISLRLARRLEPNEL